MLNKVAPEQKYELKSKSVTKPYDITNTQKLKNSTNKLIYETESDSQAQKTNLRLPKGKVEGGIYQGLTYTYDQV